MAEGKLVRLIDHLTSDIVSKYIQSSTATSSSKCQNTDHVLITLFSIMALPVTSLGVTFSTSMTS